jgi:hypothetical protein
MQIYQIKEQIKGVTNHRLHQELNLQMLKIYLFIVNKIIII